MSLILLFDLPFNRHQNIFLFDIILSTELKIVVTFKFKPKVASSLHCSAPKENRNSKKQFAIKYHYDKAQGNEEKAFK